MPREHEAPSSARLATLGWLLCSGFAIAGVAWFSPQVLSVLPPLWGDEAHFVVPAAPWSSGHTLDASAMLNPRGVFWLPSGFYLFNATLFELTGGSISIEIARLGSLALILATGCMMMRLHALVLADASAFWASSFALAWLAAPPIALAGNIVRPEALALALLSAATLAGCAGRPVVSISLSVITLCLHPLLAAPALCVAWTALWLAEPKYARVRDLWIALPAAGLCAFELFRVSTHLDDFLAHMSFQVGRKAARELGPGTLLMASVLVCLLVAAPCARLRMQRLLGGDRAIQRQLLVTLCAGCSSILVHLYGQEMWYASFRYTGLCFILVASVAWWLARTENTPAVRSRWLGAASTLLGLLAVASWSMAGVRGKVQGLPLSSGVLSAAAADRSEMESWVAMQSTRIADAKVVISPFVAAPLLGHIHEHDFYVLNPFSELQAGPIHYAIYVEHGYPGALDETEVVNALRGFVCQRAQRFVSKNGWYRVTLAAIARPDPSSQAVWAGCVAPPGFPRPTSQGMLAESALSASP